MGYSPWGRKESDMTSLSLSSQKSSKILFCVSLARGPGPRPKAALLSLGCSSLVFASPPFPDQQLFELALWNSGKVMEAKAYLFPTHKKWPGVGEGSWRHRKASVHRSPTGSCWIS